MLVTLFVPPSGKQQEIEVTEIDPEDQEYFEKHDIKLSMEELMTGMKVIYADYGNRMEDGTPIEAMEMSMTLGCREMMKKLRNQVHNMRVAIS